MRMFLQGLVLMGILLSCAVAVTPKQLWFYQTTQCVAASVSVSGGLAFTGTDNGRLVALDANTGALKWSFSIGTGTFLQNSAIVVGNTVFFGGDNGNVYALNASSGQQIWSLNTGGEINGVAPVAGKVNGVDAIFIGSGSNSFLAINAATGSVIWTFSSSGSVYSTAAWDGTNLIFGNYNGQLVSVNSQTGSSNWVATLSQSEVFNPTVANGVAYVGTLVGGSINAVSTTTGSVLWSQTVVSGVVGAPAVSATKKLVFWPINNGSVIATDFSGNGKWVYNFGGTQLNSNVLKIGAVLYIGAYHGIYALDENGNQLWNATTPGYAAQLSTPTIQSGKLYFGTCLGSTSGVYAFTIAETINEKLCGDSSCGSPCETASVDLGCTVVGSGSILRALLPNSILAVEEYAISQKCDQTTPYSSYEYLSNTCYMIATGGSFSWSK